MRGLRILAAVAGLAIAGPAPAQDVLPPSSVVIIDSEQLFLSTEYGRRIAAELDIAAAEIQAENDRIVAELLAEESGLTERRAEMPVLEFRAAAEAFDTKAQAFRRTRDAAKDNLITVRAVQRTAFFERVHPIIGALMVERGAFVVLDRRSVFLALGSADITADAIARINVTLGDGSTVTEAPDNPGPLVDGQSDEN